MTRRITQEPAWVLHRRAYRDSSLLLEVLTPRFGRVSLVARGGRQSKSASALQPLRLLHIDFVQKGELGSLGKFEAVGRVIELRDLALWSAFYLNELVLRLVSPGEQQAAAIFERYADALRRLADASPALVLRRFEYDLLALLGYALDSGADADGAPVVAEGRYRWSAQRGLSRGAQGVSGSVVLALLDGAFDERIEPAQALLAPMLQNLLGGRPLHTATMLRQLLDLRRDQQQRRATPTASDAAQ